jgi:hypothetical protein
VAFGVLDQGDNQHLAEFSLKHSALDLVPGRTVAFNLDVLSWAGKAFRMTRMSTDLRRGVVLNAREDFAGSYVDPTTHDYMPRDRTEITSRAPFVPQISSATIIPRDGGIQLKWVNPSNRSFEWVDVYRNTTNTFSGSTLIKSTRNDEHFDAVPGGTVNWYWWVTRDFAANVSSVFPGPSSTFGVAANFPVAQDTDKVFFDEFRYQTVDEFLQKWDLHAGTREQITFVQTGTFGGRVLQASGYVAMVSKVRIPYNPRALYKAETRFRLTTSRDANRQAWAGFTGFRADGQTVLGANSADSPIANQHWFVAASWQLTSLNLWTDRYGFARGLMPWPNSGTTRNNEATVVGRAARMHDLVRYVSPVVLLNHDSGASTSQLDHFSVRMLEEGIRNTLVFDPDVTDPKDWIRAVAGVTGTGSLSVVGDDVAINGAGSTIDNVTTGVASASWRPGLTVGEWGVIELPKGGGFAVIERANFQHHPIVSLVNSPENAGRFDVALRARVFTDSTSASVRHQIYYYDANGIVVHGQLGGTRFAGTDYFPTSRWVVLEWRLSVGNPNIDVFGRPQPFFVAAGVSRTSSIGVVYVSGVWGELIPSSGSGF